MKKNFTFNLDIKYGEFLKFLKDREKRSINNQIEYIIDYFCKSEFGSDVGSIIKYIDSEKNQGFYIPM